MALSIASGIVIYTQKFQDYDLIVKILTPNEIISFIALGVRKMKSKNRAALQLGNIIEVEYFRARLLGKLSKLKKSTTVKQLDIYSSNNAEIWADILKLINNLDSIKSSLYSAIVESYDYFGHNFNYQIKTYISFAILDSLGARQIMNRCAECNRHDQIIGFDFYRGGFLCKLHTKKNRPLSFLKSVQKLSRGINSYKDVNSIINKEIYTELISYIQSNLKYV